jgi:hypothetical protein
VPGQDSGLHGENALPIFLVLFSMVGNHGQNLFIVRAAEKSISRDHRRTVLGVNNDRSVAGNMSGSNQALKTMRQGVLLDPPEL